MANAYRVVLSNTDLEALAGSDAQLRDAIRRTLEEVRSSRGARIAAQWQIELVGDERARAGSLSVEALFRNAPHAGRERPRARRKCKRQRGADRGRGVGGTWTPRR